MTSALNVSNLFQIEVFITFNYMTKLKTERPEARAPNIHTKAINYNFIIKRKIYCLFKLFLSYCFIFLRCSLRLSLEFVKR